MRRKSRDLFNLVKEKEIPEHIAIIMDGNGRWAKKKRLPRIAGHRKGVEILRDVIETASELKVKHLTLYAFSTENWKRPKPEVDALMSLLVEFFNKEIDELHMNKVKIQAIGDISKLPEKAKAATIQAINKTKENNGLQLNIAINYGGRAEIVRAIKAMIQDVHSGNLSIDSIDQDLISDYLYTKGIPDPDMLIRTSGEYRISNFLLYQIAYTEFVFTSSDVLWPEFNRERFLESILEFQGRKRRYGGLSSKGTNKMLRDRLIYGFIGVCLLVLVLYIGGWLFKLSVLLLALLASSEMYKAFQKGRETS